MRGRMVILTYKVSFLWASVWWDWSLTETQINKLVCKLFFFCSFVGCKALKAPGGHRQGWHFQSCYRVHVCMLKKEKKKKEIMSLHHLLRLIRNLTVSHEDMSALHKDTKTHRGNLKQMLHVTCWHLICRTWLYDQSITPSYNCIMRCLVWSITASRISGFTQIMWQDRTITCKLIIAAS